jgi:hypothetical protein
MPHPESEWSQIASILIDNREGNLTALDLTGYLATISYGYANTGVSETAWVADTVYDLNDIIVPLTANGYKYICTARTGDFKSGATEPTWGTALGETTSDDAITWTLYGNTGDEYSACAPLEVLGQAGSTLLRQGSGSDLVTAFSCAGVFNFMAEDEASKEHSPSDTNTDTVKTILQAIAGATMACFSHCKAYTITFDSEDSLIDSYIPADYFHVGFRESRLSAFKKALKWCKCKARIEADGAIHIFNPTISGTTYDYEYTDAVTGHNFFEKSVRNRLVIPNRIYVASHEDHTPQYTGSANDSTSHTALGRYINEYHWRRITSNSQCDAIATALLQAYQVGQERGSGYAPLNCGQEVMDYVKITDSVAGDTRTGNIGYLNRITGPGIFEFEFRFGSPEMGGLAGLGAGIDESLSLKDKVSLLVERYNLIASDVDILIRNQQIISNNQELLWNRERVRKWHITEQAIAPTPNYRLG